MTSVDRARKVSQDVFSVIIGGRLLEARHSMGQTIKSRAAMRQVSRSMKRISSYSSYQYDYYCSTDRKTGKTAPLLAVNCGGFRVSTAVSSTVLYTTSINVVLSPKLGTT